MSKRSSRRKRKERQKKLEARLTAVVLTEQGLKAFQQADYDEAIKTWEQAGRKPNAPDTVSAALAEAYFRRAISRLAPRLADLWQATQLHPDESRYRYHLALAHHHQGELAQAEPLYRQLLDESFQRAALPLAQLLVEQKKAVAKDPVWTHLSQHEQTQLAAAEALITQKASTLHRPAEQALDPPWDGLIALVLDDQATAQQKLQAHTQQAAHPLSQAVARYYLGVLAAEAGQPEAAWQHWQAAQAAGLNSRHLRQNLARLAYEQALQAQQAGKPQQAAELLGQVQPGEVAKSDLKAFQRQLNLESGYTAAQNEKWQQAIIYWEKAEKDGDDSRKLIYNLALAYQKMERFRDSAEYWRTLLRRRPRKDDHPDALTDKQVARIWQNVAENYSRAGEYEEAIKTYKNAVKWAPNNIDVRLKLVEAYQTEGRWQAAENELNRILEKDPNHVPALTMLAESYSDSYWPGQARKIWQRILELEPQNPVARQQLAHSFEIEGARLSQWGQYQQAINIFQEGLKHVPNNQRLLAIMGGTFADWGKMKQTRNYLEQARVVNPNDLSTLHTIFLVWLEHGTPEDVQQTIEQAKAVTTPVPGAFFLDLAEHCHEYGDDKHCRQLLEYTEQRYPDNENTLIGIALAYLELDDNRRAVPILRGILNKNPDHVEANIQLGLAYYYMEQNRLAQRHWKTAESQARKNHDQLMLHRIKLMRDELLYGKAPPSNPIEMLLSLPPQVREQLLKTAPPEVAEVLRNMGPEELEMLFSIAGGFDDEFFDEDDFIL